MSSWSDGGACGERLDGCHAVVTGAARGIGAAAAVALAALGARVTLAGRDEARLRARAAALGDAGIAVLDVTDEDEVDAAFARLGDERGPVDVLVNNAGAAEAAPVEALTLEQWRRIVDVNLTGVFLCTRAVLPGMRARGFGRVVNVASTAALKGYREVSAYCAAKHGVLGFTRAAALETARDGITVNAVCPGYTDTDMAARAVEAIARRAGIDAAAARATLERTNPQRRLMSPEEIARAIAWLCLPASAGLTGQAIAVAGGEIG